MFHPQLPLARGEAVRYNARQITKMTVETTLFITTCATPRPAQGTLGAVDTLAFAEASVMRNATEANQ